ncbi:hypothetical protein DRN67_00920 [Candidatus Micrarchaeota archaeon]|nr:MAG: hypothetical protein DRN67_00920 [Candidatus Micrarchaeota archaeon]
MRLTYIGHSCFRIDIGGVVAYTDPFFGSEINGRPRLVAPAISSDEIKECDFIFITHEHSPHCDPDAVKEIVERTYAQVIAPRPALAKLNINEKQKVDVKEGDRFELKGIAVEVIRAVHPQSEYPVGFKISKGNESVYHAGDTYEYREMREISADVALVPIGGSYTMDPFAAAVACNEMNIKYAVPMHYNTHERIKQYPDEFARDVKRAKVVLMQPGDEFET